MDYTELHRKFEEIREFARKHSFTVVTATQPPRGGTGLSPEELAVYIPAVLYLLYFMGRSVLCYFGK